MPLRDHFRPPVTKRSSWEGFHGGWPSIIVQQLCPGCRTASWRSRGCISAAITKSMSAHPSNTKRMSPTPALPGNRTLASQQRLKRYLCQPSPWMPNSPTSMSTKS